MRGVSNRFRPIWGKTATGVTTTPVVIYIPDETREVGIVTTARAYMAFGDTYAAPDVTSTNFVTTISTYGTPTGGTFKLTAFPATRFAEETSALTFDDTAADIETAILALVDFAAGDTTAGGGALPTAVTITWGGVYAGTAPPIIGSSVALTGGVNPSLRVATTTVGDGNGGYGYVEANTPTIFTRGRDGFGSLDRYVYVASISGTVDYFLTCYS